MESKEETSPIEMKPKIETLESESPPAQSAPPSVIKRLQITTAGTIVAKTDDQPPEPSTEEIVNTSTSTLQEVSANDHPVGLQEIAQNPDIIQQETATNQFAESAGYTVSIPIESFQSQADFPQQGTFVVG